MGAQAFYGHLAYYTVDSYGVDFVISGAVAIRTNLSQTAQSGITHI